MNLQELKLKKPAELISEAEKLGIENPSTLRKQEILFAILKKLAEKNEQITATGVLEVLQDGFGFLRAIESNYLPGPDDIYVSPSQIRRFGLRTGDSVEGEIRGPKDAERYFALLKVNKIDTDVNNLLNFLTQHAPFCILFLLLKKRCEELQKHYFDLVTFLHKVHL